MRRIKAVLQFLLLLMVLYFFLRIWFWLTYFQGDLNFSSWLKVFYWGLRLDLSAIILINIPLWIFLLLIIPFIKNRRSCYVISIVLFLLINLPFLALNIVDLAYFRFNLRRSNVDIFTVIGDSEASWGMILKQFWYLFLLFVLLVLFLWKAGKRILRSAFQYQSPSKERSWPGVALLIVVFALVVRDWGRNPLTPATTLLHLPAKYQPLAENSSITFLYSIIRRQTYLEEKKYFTPQALDSLVSIRRQFHSTSTFEKKNIVVVVLESFSNSLIAKNAQDKARTPFLDSLMDKSVICANAYANGLESNKGLVALLTGIPPLLDEAYYNSAYSSNPFRGVGSLLKEKGYSTHFFMGASPDHFGFGKLCKLVGIDHYYSEREYGNKKDHDGVWGIYDHKFFPYAASKLKSEGGPFLAVLFNISSHHPYALPPALQKQIAVPGQTPQQNSVSYVDYSLRIFFDSIRSTPWYRNSIFVFVADHAVTFDVRPKPVLYNAFQIPFFIHMPEAGTSMTINKTVQQLDLVPTVLDLIHYDKPFMSFGRSVFDTTDDYAINKIFGNYQLIRGNFLYGYNEKEEQPSYFYDFKSDSLLQHNLISDPGFQKETGESEKKMKAVLQRFNMSLLKHQLTIN